MYVASVKTQRTVRSGSVHDVGICKVNTIVTDNSHISSIIVDLKKFAKRLALCNSETCEPLYIK